MSGGGSAPGTNRPDAHLPEARSRVVWKYVLPIRDVVDVPMPDMAEPLSVQEQGDDLCLWVLLDQDEPMVTRRFFIIGTGHPIGGTLGRYVGSAQTYGGALVWHVFAAPISASELLSDSDASSGVSAGKDETE